MDEEDFHKQKTIPGVEAAPVTPTEKIPTSIGPYKIESFLEKGGMSDVYLATHPETHAPVTIKVLSKKYLHYPEVVKRFLKEAEIISLADHPNVVKLYGQDEWEGGLYIAMEFIEGVSLRQYLQTTPLSLKKSLEITLEIAYALCHLHTHGIIHRDLKLENILVTESGQIKVIDFGIAQLLTEKDEKTKSTRQRIIGTPIYMSPEQRENPESVSYPSDIYSLGIVAYELVLGKLSHGKIHLSLMPKGFQKILSKALQPKPEDRYQDLVDFISDLSAYMNAATLTKEPSGKEQLQELAEKLQQAQKELIPLSLPDWDDVKIEVASHKGNHISAPYYDFFSLPEGAHGIVIASSTTHGAEGAIYTAVLHGMLRAVIKEVSSIEEMLSRLNNLLKQDPIEQVFTFCFLSLSPKENELHFLSCGQGSLWHIPAGDGSLETIEAHHAALGMTEKTEYHQVTKPWNPEDTLILTSFSPISSQEESSKATSPQITHEEFLSQIQDTSSQSTKQQLETLLRRIKQRKEIPSSELSLVMMCLKRVT